LPEAIASAVKGGSYWFVIGGQAVRCIAPYRPSRDVDFGVLTARNSAELLRQLKQAGHVELLERSEGTVHLTFEGIDVSIFVLPQLGPFVEQQRLTVEGLLATKVHAILDRGTRRDFFDLYVLMQVDGRGVLECLNALSRVYATEVNQGLVLRALSYFDDAEAEAPLPGEGPRDWQQVRAFFSQAIAALLGPPTRPRAIQSRVVDVRAGKVRSPARAKKKTRKSKQR
jgi:hypothetical protein